MKRCSWIAVLFLLPWSTTGALAQAAPDGTPERAIQDMVQASTPEEIEKHLPLSTLEAVKTLDAQDRHAFEADLMWRDAGSGEKAGWNIPEDGHAFVVIETPGREPVEIQLTDSVVTGGDAVLRFAVRSQAPFRLEVLVWMRFEEGEWRIRELDRGRFGQPIRFDDPEFVERYKNRDQKANESAATSTLNTIDYALQRYADARPDVEFPDDLSLLAERAASDEGDSDEPDSTTFLSADLARNDFVSGGYRFHYHLLRGGPQGAFYITARPADFSGSGRFSYFIDESAEVRQTGEDREATGDDPRIGENDTMPVSVDGGVR